MYSPYQAVFGHDRTLVKRMTVDEYLREVGDEERDLRGEAPRGRREAPPQYELRRAALSSRDQRVVFSSKYPMHDRLGRELCVLYQMQDMAVEAEEQRLRRDGDACRRSGVRLSAELKLDSTASHVTATSKVGDNHQTFGIDENVDVSVSTMSRTSSFAPSRPMSARPSEFSIYRDSAKPALMARSSAVAAANLRESVASGNCCCCCCCGHSSKKVRSMPATTTVDARPLDSRGRSQPLPHHHTSPCPANLSVGASNKENRPLGLEGCRESRHPVPVPQPVGIRLRKLVDHDDNRTRASRSRSGRPQSQSQCQKRSRDASVARQPSSGVARLSRVRFIDEEVEEAAEEAGPQCVTEATEADHGDGGERQGVESEKNAAEEEGNRCLGAPHNNINSSNDENGSAPHALLLATDPVRFTLARDSTAASRITKQLFRTTVGALGRGTTTFTHSHPIPTSAYGLEAATIPASKVFAEVERNFAGCGAISGAFVDSTEEDVPKLRCGRVIRLGGRCFQVRTLFLVAEVYEVVEVDPPEDPDAEEKGGGHHHDNEEEADGILRVYEEQLPTSNTATAAATATATAAEGRNDEDKQLTTSEEETPTAEGGSGERESIHWLPPAQGSARCQHLLYRWRSRHTPHQGNESRRAAAGLCLCAPEVCVSGYAFRDGAGLTLLSMPPGYRAAPLSGLPLTAASYSTLLKLVLRSLSSMVARRLVHGNLTSLGEMLVAFPAGEGEGPASVGGRAATTTAATDVTAPLLFPVHWERAVDFSMFVDRNAGRTLPFDSEDGSERPLLTLGRDIATVLQCFLEHKQAAELNSEQYVLLQKLIVMASEPTQVANYLVQIQSLMVALQTDLPSLRQAYDAAVVFYDS